MQRQSHQNKSSNRPRHVSSPDPLPPGEISKAAVRQTNLKALLVAADGNVAALAAASILAPQRLRDALDGTLHIGRETAMHLESSLKLTPAWLDLPSTNGVPPEVPAATRARLLAAVRGELSDDDDDDSHTSTVARTVAETTGAQPEAPLGLFGKARAEAKVPSVTFKRRRKAELEAAGLPDPAAAHDPELADANQATDEQEPQPSEGTAQGADTPPPRKQRGRKPGQKSIAPETQAFRLEKLLALTAEPGSKARLCRLLGAPDSFMSHLCAGRRSMTDAVSEQIRTVLGLPEGYFDVPMATSEDPARSTPAQAQKISKVPASKAVRVLDVPIQRGTQPSLREEAAPPAPVPPAVVANAPAPTPVRPQDPGLDLEHEDDGGVAVAVAPRVTAPPVLVSAPVASAATVSTAAPRVSPALSHALTSMLSECLAQNKLTNAGAMQLLSVLATAMDSPVA